MEQLRAYPGARRGAPTTRCARIGGWVHPEPRARPRTPRTTCRRRSAVDELAKELGLTNKEGLELALSLGIGVKSHSSSIEDVEADRVRRKADAEGSAPPGPARGTRRSQEGGQVQPRRPPPHRSRRRPPKTVPAQHRCADQDGGCQLVRFGRPQHRTAEEGAGPHRGRPSAPTRGSAGCRATTPRRRVHRAAISSRPASAPTAPAGAARPPAPPGRPPRPPRGPPTLPAGPTPCRPECPRRPRPTPLHLPAPERPRCSPSAQPVGQACAATAELGPPIGPSGRPIPPPPGMGGRRPSTATPSSSRPGSGTYPQGPAASRGRAARRPGCRWRRRRLRRPSLGRRLRRPPRRGCAHGGATTWPAVASADGARPSDGRAGVGATSRSSSRPR